MHFEKYIVLGKGKVAKECQKIMQDFFQTTINLMDTNDAKDSFFNVLKNCFIISANNSYLFKKECVQNNTIVNYHNSLLPKHKGMNARIWAIYEGDEKSGISWHKVDCGIDTGDILVQKEIILDENITGLKLLALQHEAAINSFKECLNNFFEGKTEKQNTKNGGGYHYKKDLPNDGYLDLSWKFEKISRFLRAMDCGVLSGIEKPKMKLFGEEIRILLYELGQNSLALKLEHNLNLTIYKEKK